MERKSERVKWRIKGKETLRFKWEGKIGEKSTVREKEKERFG
jgi:hypothetical protein